MALMPRSGRRSAGRLRRRERGVGDRADDDDDYEDECVAETWRDGGVLSEADA